MKGFLALAMLLALAVPAKAADYGIIVPVFDGPTNLARNVSTTLNLQVWRTLRRAPFPNPRGLDFGSGVVRYTREPFVPSSAREVAAYAKWAEVQMVMWGAVKELGDDVLVQAFLAAPKKASTGSEEWILRAEGAEVALGLPRRTFDFNTVVLSRQLVNLYNSPDALRMCAAKKLPCNEFAVGSDWTALRQDAEWANIVANDSGRKGWLYLPSLERLPNNISDFAAALLSYYRRDFGQAARLFSAIAKRQGQQSATRKDAAVLALVSRARAGGDVAGELARIEAEDPDSIYLFQVGTMIGLDRALAASPATRRAAMSRIWSSVAANRDLFARDDPWVAGVDGLTARFR